jgi:hypothetical protein
MACGDGGNRVCLDIFSFVTISNWMITTVLQVLKKKYLAYHLVNKSVDPNWEETERFAE